MPPSNGTHGQMDSIPLIGEFERAADEHIGLLGPFIVKRQIQKIHERAGNPATTALLAPTPAEIESLIKMLTDVTRHLFGNQRATDFNKKLKNIARTSLKEPK